MNAAILFVPSDRHVVEAGICLLASKQMAQVLSLEVRRKYRERKSSTGKLSFSEEVKKYVKDMANKLVVTL